MSVGVTNGASTSSGTTEASGSSAVGGFVLKSINLKEPLPVPGSMPTPFSKKHPPPNERPINFTLRRAASNAVTFVAPDIPFQSDQLAGLKSLVIVMSPAFSCSRVAKPVSDHQ